MNKNEFIEELKKLNIKVTDEMLEKLDIYCNFLLEYNKHTNLTSIKEENDIYLKHFYDSLTLAKAIDLNKENTLLDIGSGAGFPGMVLKIFFPHLKVYLVDSNNKKCKFLLELKEKLNVDNLEVYNNRIENLYSEFLNSIDIVTARAVTNLPVLTELAIPLVKANKYFIAMKGNAEEELENSMYAIKQLNCSIDNVITFDLYNNSGVRTLISIKKNKNTELKNIRPYDKIIKKPLQKRGK
ncbi:MAG TPA: 16S rRNA (guanine(527)-N(7))-methyltransferase RsmG [Candidatus Onthocola stercorigallinarum]|nr:16S rRNA (guanine(527)-N(7))-methyltransferase RsmG [Candidatus Onthocola stercorigallinarum]